MFPINRRDIKLQTKLPTAKADQANANPILYDQWKLKMWNIMDQLQKESVYNLGHWTIFHDRWLANLTASKVTTTYNYGDIVMVDLGATNFGSELQFEHPCIVLVNDFTSVLVIPCTSVKPHKKKYPDELDGLVTDGFRNPTRIRLHGIRWVDKKRITQKVSVITNKVLMKSIDEYIIGQFPTYHAQLLDMHHEMALIEYELLQRKAEIEDLKMKLELVEDYERLFMKLQKMAGAEVLAEAAAAVGITLPK
ncbi:type II toxin-antitoxin system PemK/MazF family toxin [Paenibacillus prosopidis]|uniref:PemK-like, MazF-like toxin of type II toxin-antitoxin system n=1 Tax=Paenibacillus prosopidis TaxID=630520 RepID=A0A368VJC2_9BACL|nr:type II toxin-antitoxin system PemK/MazF family toxin [Paenibacillus prosopidis]RCW41663.1 PemK-like, MazF-like toxin of type II toxin-antitoxin system [Paenibacillus prosopidis]